MERPESESSDRGLWGGDSEGRLSKDAIQRQEVSTLAGCMEELGGREDSRRDRNRSIQRPNPVVSHTRSRQGERFCESLVISCVGKCSEIRRRFDVTVVCVWYVNSTDTGFALGFCYVCSRID